MDVRPQINIPEAAISALKPKAWEDRSLLEKLVIHRRILAEFNQGRSATEAAQNTCNIFGEGAINVPTCMRLYQKFRTGDNSLVDSDVGIHSRGEEEQAWTWTQDGHEAEQLEQEIMKVYAADK
ncbi:histone-lysine N-methyltransferase SETMAR-like [Ditylenchus destructor]|uniref:Histone-lysine N-methyltransferase SETMAR-like n=1 Tax=Ditylenchus destructor TaxID=166010 RepID=A0AAD4MTG6_9BILA|nr:histone-lysine N-methyltransferase SETMAR-like [Ditylenchus destructor]